MKMNEVMDEIINKIKSKCLIPMNKPYQLIQYNLYKCKTVVEHILQQKYTDVMYNVDTSEYFNLVVIRISNNEFNYEKDSEYMKMCKDFKELFTESGMHDVNIALITGDLRVDNYRLSVLY